MKNKVLVLGGLREDALNELKAQCEVTIGPVGHRMEDDREWVIENIGTFDGLIVARMPIDKKIIDEAKNLKVISTYGIDYSFIDVDYATKKGITILNCPKSGARPSAELCLAMILACARRLHYYDHSMREGVFLNVNEYDNQGYSIEGKTLGLLGMGVIGKKVSQFGKMLGMNVIYDNEFDLNKQTSDLEKVDLDTLLNQSDFLVLDTVDAGQVINRSNLAKMKDSAFLINVVKSDLVDQAALISALKTGQIAGAGLDVFEQEVKPDEELASLDNVILTPHAGTATHAGRYNLTKEAAQNIASFLIDHQAENKIN